MSQRVIVTSSDAPTAIGPYSQAVASGGVLYCAGALPLDRSGELVEDSLGAATAQCLRNLAAVCEGDGTSLARALRLTVYTTDLADFAEINEAYADFFDSEPPARVAVGVAQLPRGARVEIDAIVARD